MQEREEGAAEEIAEKETGKEGAGEGGQGRKGRWEGDRIRSMGEGGGGGACRMRSVRGRRGWSDRAGEEEEEAEGEKQEGGGGEKRAGKIEQGRKRKKQKGRKRGRRGSQGGGPADLADERRSKYVLHRGRELLVEADKLQGHHRSSSGRHVGRSLPSAVRDAPGSHLVQRDDRDSAAKLPAAEERLCGLGRVDDDLEELPARCDLEGSRGRRVLDPHQLSDDALDLGAVKAALRVRVAEVQVRKLPAQLLDLVVSCRHRCRLSLDRLLLGNSNRTDRRTSYDSSVAALGGTVSRLSSTPFLSPPSAHLQCSRPALVIVQLVKERLAFGNSRLLRLKQQQKPSTPETIRCNLSKAVTKAGTPGTEGKGGSKIEKEQGKQE